VHHAYDLRRKFDGVRGNGMEAQESQSTDGAGSQAWPSVTIVILSFNRAAELRTNLRAMLFESAYPRDGVDVIVVDNASEDGSAEMVREEFPEVRLIERTVNCGVSGWNNGFAVATGDLVLALDDDCYLPGDGLNQAVLAMQEHRADLVSFGVTSSYDPSYRFDEGYRTGLLSFWGCAVLMRRQVLTELKGYDPEIFVWANELEFMLRFFDRGFRHLHLPEVVAVHMKDVKIRWYEYIGSRNYRINSSHFAYIAAKRLRTRDALEAFVALVVVNLRDAHRVNRDALGVVPDTVRSFIRGWRHRDPVRSKRVSRTFRRNFESFASPWWLSRRPTEFFRAALPKRVSERRAPKGRREQYYAERARFYPECAATLEL
jgi:GT2 family glycosyltransferase